MNQPSVSICIPTYEMHGEGKTMLLQLLNSIQRQTYVDYEVIVSDHSKNDELAELCAPYPKLTFVKNSEDLGNSSANINKALDRATGDLIKPMFQDDLFHKNDSLEKMVALQKSSSNGWIICGCLRYAENAENTFGYHPASWGTPEQVALGNNTVGDPSCILYRKTSLRFDPALIWLMDCEFYFRLYKKYGIPGILPEAGAVIRVWEHSVSNSLATDQLRRKEYDYVKGKYGL